MTNYFKNIEALALFIYDGLEGQKKPAKRQCWMLRDAITHCEPCIVRISGNSACETAQLMLEFRT